MKRRDFIRVSAAGLLPLLLRVTESNPQNAAEKYEIEVLSDKEAGHTLFRRHELPVTERYAVENLIVGGGVAGVTATYLLRHQNTLLCEASEVLGGSSSAHHYEKLRFSMGAHYDLAYPQYYGTEGLKLLQEIGVTVYNPHNQLYEFREKDLLIPEEIQERCYEKGQFREDVLGHGEEARIFQQLMARFMGKMPMPTTEIDAAYHHLDALTFQDWLSERHPFSPDFIRRVDYQMLDDWGATCARVSALAGIHYYACRPYQSKSVELLSPPEGNYYFIEKMLAKMPKQAIKTRHLVSGIKETEGGAFEVEVIDVAKKSRSIIHTQNVVYCGQKHTLPYLMPEKADLFKHNVYAPWVVVSFVLDAKVWKGNNWQNDMITDQKAFLGFVDSGFQSGEKDDFTVLTAYFCFDPKERKMVARLADHPNTIVETAIAYINTFQATDIRPAIKKAFVKPMGHAMPVPSPGYLTRDKNRFQTQNLVFAGVDTGRLPVFFEAMDSAIQACKALRTGPLKSEGEKIR